MAINLIEKIKTLSSIYSDDREERELEVHYSLPNRGINEETGILMYIAGFRGLCRANVFKKLRRTFADKYNLVVVQCDYFGYQYMRKPSYIKLSKGNLEILDKSEIIELYKDGKVHCDEYIALCDKYRINTKVKAVVDENINSFNEMGLMQALDNINALQHVIRKLEKGGAKFNGNKVIFFGNSQGAYLSHLCNILAPKMISLIIDNSGWVFPEFLKKDRRVVTIKGENSEIKVSFDYIARNVLDDFQILDLHNLYEGIDNKCRIIAYHGSEDDVIKIEDKNIFLDKVINTELNVITKEKVDGEIFSSCKHGMKANFIKLFDLVMEREDISFTQGEKIKIPDGVYLKTDKYHYAIDFGGQYPVLSRVKI